MDSIAVDWVVEKYLAGDSTSKFYPPTGEILEVGNFDTMVILAEARKATNVKVLIQTAVDRGQLTWSTLTEGTFSGLSGAEIKISRASDTSF
jgi:hypothetical protein